MKNEVNTSITSSNDTPAVTPEQLVEQIRAMRDTVGDLASLTRQQRAEMRRAVRVPNETLQAQISLISGQVETSLGQNSADVRLLMDDANRWSAVQYELKSLLDGIEEANLVRRHKIALLATQANVIGEALARDPKNVALASQVKEVRRIKRTAARKKPASQETPPKQTPPPADQHTMTS